MSYKDLPSQAGVVQCPTDAHYVLFIPNSKVLRCFRAISSLQSHPLTRVMIFLHLDAVLEGCSTYRTIAGIITS